MGLEIPIEFEFEGRAVVGLTQLETDPKDIIRHEDFEKYINMTFPTLTSLGLPTCKLKPNQSIQLGVLLNGPSGKTNKKEGSILNGRIIDSSQVKRRNNFMYRIILFVLLLLILGLLVLSTIISNSSLSSILFATIGMIAVIVSFLTLRPTRSM
jgi:hypothetical protein